MCGRQRSNSACALPGAAAHGNGLAAAPPEASARAPSLVPVFVMNVFSYSAIVTVLGL
jgi:hypothetical protein